jgi:tetratricopeptide (TPR) repeat protein
LEESLKNLKQNLDQPKDFKTLSQLGQDYQAKRQFQKALAYSKKAYELVKTEADSDSIIIALINIGAIYWDMSQLKKATKLFQDSLLIVERTGDNVGRRMLYSIIGISTWRIGKFVKAIEWFEEALKATPEAKVEYERTQLVPPWKYEILHDIMVRGIITLKNRIQTARNQQNSARILLPSITMVPLMLFTGQKGAIPNLLEEIAPLAKELKNNKILNTISALEKIIRV